MLLASAAQAATITWTNAAGTGNWNTAGNWSTNTVPSTIDDVVFNAASVANASLSANTAVKSLTVDATYTGVISLNTYTFTVGNLTVPAAANLNAGSSTVLVNTSAVLNSVAPLYNLTVNAPGTAYVQLAADLQVSHDFTLTSVGFLQSTNLTPRALKVDGAVALNSAWGVGGGAVTAVPTLTGSTDQTYTGTANVRALAVAKTGGDVLLNSTLKLAGTLSGSGLLKSVAGTKVLMVGDATFNFAGTIDNLEIAAPSTAYAQLAADLQVNQNFTLTSVGFLQSTNLTPRALKVDGAVALNSAWGVGGGAVTAVPTLTGSTDQTYTGTANVPVLNVAKTGGDVLLNSTLKLAGTLSGSGLLKSVAGTKVQVVSGATINFTGTMDNLEIAAGAGSFTQLAADLQVNQNFTLTSATYIQSTSNTPWTIQVKGNATVNSTWATSSSSTRPLAVLTLTGSTSQTLTTSVTLPNLTIAKTAGRVDVTGGTFAVTTFNVTGYWDVSGVTLTTASIPVQSGATLTGAGTLNGNLTLNSGSTYRVVVDDAATPVLNVNGTVTINGATLTGSTSTTLNATQVILNNDLADAIAGTKFTGATANGSLVTLGGTQYGLYYNGGTGNDLALVPMPVVTSFSPTSGPVGTIISLAGSAFTGTTAVTFTGTSGNVVTTGFTVASATSITGVVVPAGAVTGTLTVTTPTGTSPASSQTFTVTPSLSNLVLSAGTISPTFASGTTNYTLTVPGTTAATTVTPTNAQTSGGTITVNGTAVASGAASGSIALAPGANTLTVVVNPTDASTPTTYTVTVTRNCAVTAAAKNMTLALSANGSATLAPSTVDNGSTGTCGPVTLSVTPNRFTCANVGPNTVTLTVKDTNGNQNTATATVTVVDNTAPTVYCQPITRQLDANGQVSITANDLVAPPVVGLATGAGNLNMAVANDVAVGDLDGDGDKDVVYANNGQSAVYLNDGTGTFTPHPTTPLLGGTSDQHHGVALGDVDGDGDLDLVFAVLGGNETVYANNGSGAFTLLGSFAGQPNTYDVALADIDGDGDLDAAVVNIDGFQLWRNNGSGTFTAVGAPQPGNGHVWQVQFARLNADTSPDLLISGDDGRVESVYLNNGSGSFAAQPTTPTFGGGSFNLTDAVGDVDGDGDQDVVYGNGSSVVVWYNANNTGAFSTSQTFATAQPTNDIVLADMENDGDLDIVMGSGPLQVLLNNGSGSFTALANTANAGQPGTVQVLAAADFDGDGLTDVVGGRWLANTSLNYFRNNTTRTADLCGGTTLSASKLTFDCSNLGANTVTLTATDASGNANSCQAVVTIQDLISPVAVAQNVTVTLGADGTAAVTAAQVDNGSTDNCGIATRSLSTTSFTCSTPTTSTPNNYGLHFDGSDDYFDLGTVLAANASYTKEMWVKANDASCRNLLSGVNQHQLWLSGGKLQAGHGTTYSVVQDPAAFPLNTWVHVAVSYDAATRTMKLYRNGSLVASTSGAGVPAYATTNALLGSHGGCFFSGDLDEVRIWSTVRTAAEILSTKDQMLTGSEAGLLALYNFENGASNPTTLVDVSGHGYTGSQPTAAQRPTWVAASAPVTSPARASVTLTVTDAAGNSNTATAFVTILTSSAASVPTLTWTGTANTDWNDCGNWSYGLVPSANQSVSIPAGLSRYPVLSAGTATVNNVTVASGASLTVASGATLQVNGNIDNSGPAFAGTVRLTGTGAQAVTSTFGTLEVNKPSGTASLGANTTVNTALNLTSGTLNTGSYALTLGSTATMSESATGYVTGTVQTTRPVATPGSAQTFGGLGLTLTPASGSTALPGNTLVRRVTGTALSGANNRQSVLRYFDIQPTTNAGLNITLDFAYLDAELNGIAEGNLAFFRSTTGTSGPWQLVNASGRNAAANTITATGVDHFSIWTLGNSASPLPVELTAFTAEQQGSSALLHWSTASEKNNDRFEVEASADGQRFAHIGTVQGQGNSISSTDYRFVDEKLTTYSAAVVYYRLRQVDADGKASYSPVRSIALKAAEQPQLVVFPTVATAGQAVEYRYSGPALPTGATLDVFDMVGRQVGQQAAAAAGSLNLKALTTGWYLVRLRTATGVVQDRFYQP